MDNELIKKLFLFLRGKSNSGIYKGERFVNHVYFEKSKSLVIQYISLNSRFDKSKGRKIFNAYYDTILFSKNELEYALDRMKQNEEKQAVFAEEKRKKEIKK